MIMRGRRRGGGGEDEEEKDGEEEEKKKKRRKDEVEEEKKAPRVSKHPTSTNLAPERHTPEDPQSTTRLYCVPLC